MSVARRRRQSQPSCWRRQAGKRSLVGTDNHSCRAKDGQTESRSLVGLDYLNRQADSGQAVSWSPVGVGSNRRRAEGGQTGSRSLVGLDYLNRRADGSQAKYLEQLYPSHLFAAGGRATSLLTVTMRTLGMGDLFHVARNVSTLNFSGLVISEHYVGYK